jgi:hypothetical protein
MAILPIEPEQWDEENDDGQYQQFLDSERGGAIVEDFIGVEFEDEGVARIEGPSDQIALGSGRSPILLNATITLPASIEMDEAGREIGPIVDRVIREGMATDIQNDWDEFVYVPLKDDTVKAKQRKGLPFPTTPLYGTGELIKQMRPGGWMTEFKWDDNVLAVKWGPKAVDDQNPSDKYKNMFFGSSGTGRGHQARIPRRFPQVSDHVREQVVQVMLNWLRLKQNQTAAISATDSTAIWTY